MNIPIFLRQHRTKIVLNNYQDNAAGYSDILCPALTASQNRTAII
jgi:hypothetical protein